MFIFTTTCSRFRFIASIRAFELAVVIPLWFSSPAPFSLSEGSIFVNEGHEQPFTSTKYFSCYHHSGREQQEEIHQRHLIIHTVMLRLVCYWGCSLLYHRVNWSEIFIRRQMAYEGEPRLYHACLPLSFVDAVVGEIKLKDRFVFPQSGKIFLSFTPTSPVRCHFLVFAVI